MAQIRKIEKRTLPSGLVSYRAPYTDANGIRRSRNFATAKEAKAFLQTTGPSWPPAPTPRPRSRRPSPKPPRCGSPAASAKGWRPRRWPHYGQHVDLHIVPFVGETKLFQLTTAAAINSFVDRIHAEGRSPEMIKKVMISLGGILREARRRGLAVADPNQGPRSRSAGTRRSARRGPDQGGTAGDHCRRPRAAGAPRFLVAIFCGLRASELRGLFWSDVDLDGGLIHVQRRADDSHKLGRLKSASGYRAIPLPPIVVNALREWKLACPKGELGLVFPNKIGKVESYANIMQRGFAPIQIKAGITGKRDGRTVAKYGLHALRHACASLWIEEGHNPKQIQKLMGHSSITTTYDIYGHLFADAEADQRAAASVQARLLGKGS